MHDLRAANAWAEHNLAIALRYVRSIDHESSVDNVLATCAGLTLSTCFSGTGGGELAAHGGLLCVKRFACISDRTLWACDYNECCRRELQLLPHPPECIFRDVNEVIVPSALAKLKENAARMRYCDLQKINRASWSMRCDNAAWSVRDTQEEPVLPENR